MLSVYKEDYAAWVEDTARAIEDGRFHDIDRAALADEVRDLGKSERRELRSAIEVLLMQMLKARYQPEKQTRSWGLTMRVQRNHIAEYLKESPSLRRELPEFIATTYHNACLKAADETGLELDVFPESCEWRVPEVLAEAPAVL